MNENDGRVQLKPELVAATYRQRVMELEEELTMARAYITQLQMERDETAKPQA